MSEAIFKPSKLTLKVKFIAFSVTVVVLIAFTGLLFYNRTYVAMQKDLSGRTLSVAQDIARNPNLKLGLVNEDQNLISGIIETAARQRGVLYVAVKNVDGKFNLKRQNKNSDAFSDYYSQFLDKSQAIRPDEVSIQHLDSGKRFLAVRVPILRGKAESGLNDSLLLLPSQIPADKNTKSEPSTDRNSSENEILGFIDLGVSFEGINQGMRWVGFWATFLLSLIVVMLLGFLLVVFRFVIRPVEIIAERAARISEGDLSQQVTVRARDEIGQLSFNFNLMAERLAENQKARDEYANQLSLLNGQLEQTNQQLQDQFEQVSKGKREWETTFNAMADAVFIFDQNHKLRQVNNAGRVLGDRWSRMLGRDDCCLLLSENKCETNFACADCSLDQVFRGGKLVTFERVDSETNEFYLITLCPIPDADGNSVGAIAVLRDITEEKMLRVQLLQSEKMSAIGQLVSGVAHELNNPLNAVIGYSQLCMENPLFNQELSSYLTCVVNEGLRARKIVQNLLTVSRQHKPEKKSVNINDILRLTLDLRSYEMRVSNIEIAEEFDAQLPLTMCDPHQLQQVFLNVIVNAEQAMLATNNGGHLAIQSVATRDNSIQVRITDDGPGIPTDKIARIFDPFFTTKDVGEGTGLGLSISYGIMKEHGGHIWVQSQEGSGSTFIVELPVISDHPSPSVEKNKSQQEIAV